MGKVAAVERFSKKVEGQLLAVLRLGNRVAKKQARRILGKKKLAVLHQVLRNPRANTHKITEEQLAEILSIPADQVLLIKATWQAAGPLLTQYRLMVIKMMRRLALRLGITDEQSLCDLEGEATVGFLKAIRGYSKAQFAFTTYFCCCVRTEIRRYIKRTRGLSGANEQLLMAYRRTWEALATAGKPHDFWACCLAMELKPKQVRRLWGTLQEPVSEQELQETLQNLVVDRNADGLDYDLVEAIGMVDMSSLERDAFEASGEVRGIFPRAYKNLKEVAAAHGVSPQAANYAWKRAQQLLASRMFKGDCGICGGRLLYTGDSSTEGEGGKRRYHCPICCPS